MLHAKKRISYLLVCCIVALMMPISIQANDAEISTSQNNFLNENESSSKLPVYLNSLPIVSYDRYTGNMGDSFVNSIGTRNSSTGISGETYQNGLEVWIARWNFMNETSWAWAEYDISSGYNCLKGSIDVSSNCYNRGTYNSTLQIIGDGNVLFEQILTPQTTYPIDINVDVRDIKTLKIYAFDNASAMGGTSFLLGDLRLVNTNDSKNSEVYPKGYDFYKDSYNFRNYGESISKKYFTTIYEDGPGTLLYRQKKDISTHGLCFGMTYTTAAILNGMPSCSIITTFDKGLFKYKYCDNIREIPFPNLMKSAFTVGNNVITLEDYIKYAFIYQFSSEVVASGDKTYGDIQGLYDTVKQFTDDGKIGVTIGMIHIKLDSNGKPVLDKKGKPITSGHQVLAVGYVGNDILIDDPNNKETMEKISIHNDGSWKYSGDWTSEKDGVNSDNSLIRYQVDIHRPYQILLTGNATTVSKIYSGESINAETYIENMNELDADSILVCVDGDDILFDTQNTVEIKYDEGQTDESPKSGSLYWVKDNSKFVASKINGQNNKIDLAGDNVILSANVNNATNLIGEINDSDSNLQFNGKIGDECTLSYASILNDNETTIEVSGRIADDSVHINSMTNGLEVEGLSKGTIKLIKNDSEIKTQDFEDCDNDLSIIYDQSGNDDSLKVLSDEHNYSQINSNENGHWYKCSNCDATTNIIPHIFDNDCDEKCDICGYIRSVSHNYSKLQYDENEHWYICITCGKEKTNSREHHNGGTATCQTAKKCSVCAEAYGNKDMNNHISNEFIFSDNGNGTHTKKYKCCGTIANESEKHIFGDDNICDKCNNINKLEENNEDTVNKTTTVYASTNTNKSIDTYELNAILNDKTKSDNISSSPKTSDNNNLNFWILLIFISFSTLIILRKKKNIY